MLERLLISGAGGHGVILAGRVLANVAAREIRHVTFFPDYGAEVRGGSSKCQVVLSSEEIASPVSDVFESMIVMNQTSLDCFLTAVPSDGLVILNTSLCREPEGRTYVGIAATELADKMGDMRSANFILLGAYVKRRPYVPPAAVEDGIRSMLGRKSRELADLNVRAFREGLNA